MSLRIFCFTFLLAAPVGSALAQLDLALDPVASGFSRPVLVTHAGDGSGRLFVVENRGKIRIVDSGGTVLPTEFLDLSNDTGGLNRVSQSGNERGLLGMAFHPDYASNGRFFVSYTRASDGASIVEEFSVSGDPNVADTSSGQVVFGPLAQPDTNHNGGHIAFHPTDGYLYYGLGDGGGAGDNDAGHTLGLGNGQDPTNQFGTILRYDVDAGFTPPPSNPYFGVAGFLDEIYAYGLRNPWRFSFDRGGTHRLFCGDVGQGDVEEIDLIEAGDNMGWRRMEGSACFNPSTGCQTGSLVLPIFEYGHSGGRISVTGGYVYRGTQFPNMFGKYFLADYGTGEIWFLEETSPGVWEETLELDAPFSISSFGEDEEGELYVCQFTNLPLQIHRLIDNNVTPAPEISITGAPVNFGDVGVGVQSDPMSFTIRNVGLLDLTFSSISLASGDTDQFIFDPAPPDTSDLGSTETRQITLRFVPTSEGSKSAIVTVSSNDADESDLDVTVTGTGTEEGPTSVSNWVLY